MCHCPQAGNLFEQDLFVGKRAEKPSQPAVFERGDPRMVPRTRLNVVECPLYGGPVVCGHGEVVHPVVRYFFDPFFVQVGRADFLDVGLSKPLNPGEMQFAQVLDREGVDIRFFVRP